MFIKTPALNSKSFSLTDSCLPFTLSGSPSCLEITSHQSDFLVPRLRRVLSCLWVDFRNAFCLVPGSSRWLFFWVSLQAAAPPGPSSQKGLPPSCAFLPLHHHAAFSESTWSIAYTNMVDPWPHSALAISLTSISALLSQKLCFYL